MVNFEPRLNGKLAIHVTPWDLGRNIGSISADGCLELISEWVPTVTQVSDEDIDEIAEKVQEIRTRFWQS